MQPLRPLFTLLFATVPSQCYIHSTVKLWDINQQNHSRSIDLLGDWHEEHEANRSQFSYLKGLIEERKVDKRQKPLHILVEDPVLPADLFLNYLTDYSKQNGESDRVKIENIDTRAASLAACWLLMHDSPCSDVFQSLRAYDRDSEYAPHDLSFQDISIAFDIRKQQIKNMCERLNYSTSLFSSELAEAHRSFNTIQTNLKEWGVDKNDRVATISDMWFKDGLSNQREQTKRQLINSFTKLSNIYTTLYIKAIPHNYDILLCTGGNDTWFITSMLKRLGAWCIDEHQNNFTLQGQQPVSEAHLRLTQEQPRYYTTQGIKMWLTTLSHCCSSKKNGP